MAIESDMLISILIGTTAVASFLYLRFLYRCLRYWQGPSQPASREDFPSVTVIVPARNESEHIIHTLESIDMQSVPVSKVEVVVVDDHSEDDTVSKVMEFMAGSTQLPFRLLSLDKTFSKKSAIKAGVDSSVSDWIVTVDADVLVKSDRWLSTMMNEAEEGVSLICGPVLMENGRSGLFGLLAQLESLGLLVIAGGHVFSRRPLFCNGANLAFRRLRFLETVGFDRQRLTGDDTDLLHLFPPSDIRFCTAEQSLLTTVAPSGVSGFFSQRQRWASKIPRALAHRLLSIGLTAWLIHAGILSLFFYSMWHPEVSWIPGLVLFIKSLMEYSVLNISARRYGRDVRLPVILLLQPVYILSITIIGIMAVLLPYRWKGRTD